MNDYECFVMNKVATPIECSWLGLAGEVGEVLDLIKKAEYHGHTMDREKLLNELGDVLFYLTDITNRYAKATLADIQRANMDKLNKRYKAAFTQEESKNRAE